MDNEKNKLEAAKTSELKKWIEANTHESYPAEVKVERGKKFYFSTDSFPKEYINLVKTTMTTVSYKNPDTGYGTPYDLCVYSKCNAYLFIFFGDVKKFYMIHIDKITEEMENGENGITEERAAQIAFVIGYIK